MHNRKVVENHWRSCYRSELNFKGKLKNLSNNFWYVSKDVEQIEYQSSIRYIISYESYYSSKRHRRPSQMYRPVFSLGSHRAFDLILPNDLYLYILALIKVSKCALAYTFILKQNYRQ